MSSRVNLTVSLRRQTRRLALALLALVVAAVQPYAAISTAPRAQAAGGPTNPVAKYKLCAWTSAAIGSTRFGNTGWIDTRGTYLLQHALYLPGASLRIQGRFPYARFMSFTAYAGRDGNVAGYLDDYQIAPDRGSINPSRPGADRHATRRSYTIYIQQGPAPQHPAPNTIYTGPYRPVLIMYRIYAPDSGANEYGQVAKPSIDLIVGTPQSHTQIVREPTCASPKKAGGTVSLSLSQPMRWYRVGAMSRNGVNVDDAYLAARLNSYDAQVFIVRFKAPTFPDTYTGQRITGREDTRFWSLCMYNMANQRVIDCLHDYQAVRSANGYVTVVLSTQANRPSAATRANGVNWLPFGPQQIGLLIYRQLLPLPAFKGSFMNLDPKAYPFEMKYILGRYLPVIQTCSQASFTPTSCTDEVDPTLCTDLIEPAPCPPSQDIRRAGAASAWRARP